MARSPLLKYRRPHKKCSHCRIALRKVSTGRQFTGKNPQRPGGRRARRILAGKLSAGGDIFGGDPIMGHRSTLLTVSTAR